MIKFTSFLPKISPIASYYLQFLTQSGKFSLFFLSLYSYAKVSINSLFILLILCSIVGISQAADFFVSTTGNDDNNGSESSPWKKIHTSISKLNPGDTLNIVDGVYFENIVPNVSGTATSPILIKAINPFKVIIDGGGEPADTNEPDNSQALLISGVSYLTFEGFKFKNSSPRKTVLQLSSRDGQPATGNTETHHITLRKISVQGSCRLKNCVGFLIARSNNILLEDAWVYGAGRYTLLVYGSRNVTVRRVVARWDAFDGSEDKPNDPRIGIGVYNTHDSLFENVIVIDAGKRPPMRGGDKKAFALAGGDNGNTAPFKSSSNNKFYGLVIFNNIGLALSQESRNVPHDSNSFENSVIYGNSIAGVGILKKVTNSNFSNLTVVGHPREGYSNNSNANTFGNTLTNSIITDNGNKTFKGEVTESFNMVFNNSPNYPNGVSAGEGSIIMDPEQVFLFKNDTLPLLNNLGSNGLPRGANLLFRYENGVETTQNLWPWQYEAEILQDFCNPAILQELGRVGDNSAPWCDSGKSLTQYLWESNTALACPGDICIAGSTDLIFANSFD